MDCEAARPLLRPARRGSLDAETRAALGEHLAGCEACRAEDAADQALDQALSKLPRPRPPEALRQALERVAIDPPPRQPRRVRMGVAVAAFFAGAAIAAAVTFAAIGRRDVVASLVDEAVNDHVRIVSSTHPYDVVSSDLHTVKPWFAGKFDFAPRVVFEGDEGFPLEGGAMAYFVDRPAAAYVYRRRRHHVTVLVFRAEGFAWPTSGLVPVGRVRASEARTRGFSTLLFRDGDLGYALISDTDIRELEALAAKLAG